MCFIDIELLIGNSQKTKEKLCWQSNTKFDKLVWIYGSGSKKNGKISKNQKLWL